MSDSTEDPNSVFSGDVVTNGFFAPYMRVLYAVMHLETITTGIQLVLCIYGFAVFTSTASSSLRKQRLPYVILSFVILGCFMLSNFADSIVFARMSIESGDESAKFPVVTLWYDLAGTIGNMLVNFIGDGLMIYRCYIIWSARRWVLIFPIFAYVASICFAIISVTSQYFINMPSSEFSIGWMALSVFVNVAVTAMIAFPILRMQKRLAKVLDPSNLSKYTRALSILIESALPLSLCGIVAAVFYTDGRLAELPVGHVFLGIWGCLAALCPQLIIFRVMVGSSIVNDLGRSGQVSQPIVFARGGNTETDVVGESDRSHHSVTISQA